MQILFGRLGAERKKIILLKFSLCIDEIWGRFFFFFFFLVRKLVASVLVAFGS